MDAAQALSGIVERVLAEAPELLRPRLQPEPGPKPPPPQVNSCDERHRDGRPDPRQVPKALAAQVWRRDGFRCRFCSRRLVPTAISWAIHELAPLRFPMHRNSGRACHPWAQATYADAEHVFPRKRGGSSRHEGNLVAACERCNRHVKGARTPCEIGWTLLGVADDGWDGLVWAHEPLIALLGSRGGRPLEGEPVLPYRDGAAWRQVLMAPAVPLAPARQDGVTQQEEQREGYRPRW